MSLPGAPASPLVSLVVTSYNYAHYIRETIDSALAQDYPNVEIVVVDDGSKDGSPEIIRSYGDRVVPLLQENQGQKRATNSGYALSRGDYVLFLDSDDRLLPHAVSTFMKAFGPGVSKVQFTLAPIDGQGNRLPGRIPERHAQPGEIAATQRRFLYYAAPPNTGNAYSRAFLEKRMPIPLDVWNVYPDTYLIFAAPFYGEIRVIEEPLAEYRVHSDSASHFHDGNFRAYIDLEYGRMKTGRDYVASVIRENDPAWREAEAHPTPCHLKFAVGDALYGRNRRATLAEAGTFLRHALAIGLHWNGWKTTWKRWLVLPWVVVALLLPGKLRDRFLQRTVLA